MSTYKLKFIQFTDFLSKYYTILSITLGISYLFSFYPIFSFGQFTLFYVFIGPLIFSFGKQFINKLYNKIFHSNVNVTYNWTVDDTERRISFTILMKLLLSIISIVLTYLLFLLSFKVVNLTLMSILLFIFLRKHIISRYNEFKIHLFGE